MACFEGCFEGKEIDYEQQVPEQQKEFAKKFFEDFLTPALEKFTLGQGATPYQGPLTAPAFNPFTQSAMDMMAKSPYGKMGNFGQAPGFGTFADYNIPTRWQGGDGDGGDDGGEIDTGTPPFEEIDFDDEGNIIPPGNIGNASSFSGQSSQMSTLMQLLQLMGQGQQPLPFSRFPGYGG